MKKRLILAFFAIILSISLVLINGIKAEGGATSSDKITYTEKYLPEYNRYVRDYSVNKNYFNFGQQPLMPDGKVVYTMLKDEDIELVMDELNQIQGLSRDYLNVALYNTVNGSSMYCYSSTTLHELENGFENLLKDVLDERVVLKARDFSVDVTDKPYIVGAYFIVDCAVSDGTHYYLTFHYNDSEIRPMEVGDIICLNVGFYINPSTNEARYSLYLKSLLEYENMFSATSKVDSQYHGDVLEYLLFNGDYGLPTDDCLVEFGQRYESYNVKLYCDDYLLIAEYDSVKIDPFTHEKEYMAISCIEFENFPSKPTKYHLEVSFTSGGKEYHLISNQIEILPLNNQILLDGFNNRNVVGDGVTHEYIYNDIYLDNSTLGERDRIEWYVDGCCFMFDSEKGCFEKYESEYTYSGAGIKLEAFDKDPTHVKITFTEDEYVYPEYVNEEDKGKHEIMVNIMIDNGTIKHFNLFANRTYFNVIVQKDDPVHISVDDALTVKLNNTTDSNDTFIDFDNDNILILEGNDLNIVANVDADVLGTNTSVEYTWKVEREGVVTVVSNGENATIIPLTTGIAKILLTAEANTIGVVRKEILFRVLSFEKGETEIYVEDAKGFHKSHNDVTAYLMVDGYTKILNANINWAVMNSEDEEKVIDFVKNSDGSITLKDYSQGNYIIKADIQGYDPKSLKIRISDVDMNKVTRTWLPIIAILMVVIAGLLVLLKTVFGKKHSIEKKLSALIDYYESIDESNYQGGLKKTKRKMHSLISSVDDFNLRNSGQYEQVIKKLNNSFDLLKKICKQKEISYNDFNELRSNMLTNDLKPALNLTHDIENALDEIVANQKNANLHNIAVLEPEKVVDEDDNH